MFIRRESTAQSFTGHYNKKVGKHFSIPSVPSPSAPLSSPGWQVCLHLSWDNLLEYPDFPCLICLKEINGHYCGQIYPKPELSSFGNPTNRAHPKRDSAKSSNWLNNYYLKGQEAWKQIKTILIINAIIFIFFEPAMVVSRYMTCALFRTIKNWVF